MLNLNNITTQNITNGINAEKARSFWDIIVVIFNYGCDVGFVFLPSVGYIHQYMKINNLQKREGFSKLVSFILIMSYIFRIFFWIGKHFEISILFNAIFGIFIQLLLLRICIKFDTTLQKSDSLKRLFNIKEFWNWPYFVDYLFFVFFISTLISIVSLIVGYNNEIYVFILGVITSIIESFCDVPQIYELYKSKNPYTVSYLMIFFWLSGDIFKVTYFLYRDTPIQLIACAIFQLTTDIILTSQIVYYRYFYHKKEENSNITDKELNKEIIENNYDNVLIKNNNIFDNNRFLEKKTDDTDINK